jgi:2-oxoisovalerate dehydrogenase E1 component
MGRPIFMDASLDYRADRLHEGGLTASAERPIAAAVRANGWQPASQVVAPTLLQVGMSSICTAEGTLRCSNDQIAQLFPEKTAEDIFRRTGIESRCRVAPGESAVTLGVDAARQALRAEGIGLARIGALICSTTTPPSLVPSTACLILNRLAVEERLPAYRIRAYDVSAACSGYLYALASGFDFLQTHPEQSVLIVTTEVMSQAVDPRDFGTSILFGDAATATILHGCESSAAIQFRLAAPLAFCLAEDGTAVNLPCGGTLRMRGREVFSEAVRNLGSILEQACVASGLEVGDLAWVVPHQANERISEALRSRLPIAPDRVYSNIRHRGNTASSSVPLCLAEMRSRTSPGDLIGVCTFGGGFTLGAAILEAA